MKFKKLATQLKIKYPKNLSSLELYDYVRRYYFDTFKLKYSEPFQSPSINPTTTKQRSKFQLDNEHSVYQRSDYTPLSLENHFNSYYKQIDGVESQTIAFNSGMAAISSLIYYLYHFKKINKLALGENAYFETKWIAEDYGKYTLFNEYTLEFPQDCDAYWLEFPINCTSPDRYPFEKQLNLEEFFSKFLKIVKGSKKEINLVIDYTLGYIPFDVSSYLSKLPDNLTIYLVSSLQKHRGYGLDMTNSGVITYYSKNNADNYEGLIRIRAITGTSITQESVWLMPQINNKLINQIIKDSGNEAKKLFNKCNNLGLPIKLYFSDNKTFDSCFIFIKIDQKLMKRSVRKPYYSDLLIAELVKSAKRNKCILVNSTSFGFPFSRIFKNSERYSNADSLRIAVGYDSEFNLNLDKAINEGIINFLRKYS